MKISYSLMEEIHNIQLEMFKELLNVLNRLEIRYFFVHGSLLGAVRDNSFIAEDDDIDLAIFRKDYNRLFLEGPKIIDSRYFLQNSLTDEYPLAMGKMRNSDTAFIQPILGKCKCNKGIYIDIFPIDYHCDSLFFKCKNKLLGYRINEMYLAKKTIKTLIASMCSRIIYPSVTNALKKREMLYTNLKKSSFVSIFCGKQSEQCMPIDWFQNCVKCVFCGIEVNVPGRWQEYLARIYGSDYIHYNPAHERIDLSGQIEVSAEILDLTKSYKCFN